ncbi:MAG: hypothetical protein JJ964_16465, partial [Rhizobiales bacterium]|nr:hypothetical protein [Hyphomicrobiales bacterium]
MYEEFDVIVYAPLEEEYKGLQIRFIPDSEIDGNNFTGYKFTNDENITILFVHGFDWGNDAAYTVMNEVFSRFKAKLSVCIGIGGAITDDAKLGDVFYSKEVLDLTQRLKTQRDGDNNSRTKYDPKTYLCSTDLVKALDRSRLSISGKSIFKKWQESCELINRGSLVSVDTTELGHQSHYFERPNANNGKIAATNTVLADKMAVEDVKSCGRKITCVDTESAGFARSCNENQNSGAHIIIRAISDLADENKKLTEESFSNIFRDIAVSNAALFFSCHLGLMLNSLKEIPKNLAIDATLTLKQKHEREIDKNEQSILKELTARSIAFKSLEQKNGMPVPRIRPINLLTEVVENKNEPAIEIEEALKENNNISIDVPKNYPDNALPWLYAHQLAEANLHGKYTIPICIPNNEFGPPKNNLVAHLQSNNLEFAQNNDDYHIVFIFTNFKISSRSKSKYLSDSVKEFHNASVIIFPDVLEMEIYNNELEKYFNHKCYNIEAISFTSITQYMSSAFEIPLEESEVVATRLVSTFNNYRLNIHPTYLASIQKDTVASFIEANQRGELIELAVAGLLTLLVS